MSRGLGDVYKRQEYGWGDENVSYEGTYTNEFAQVAADTLGMTDPEAK